MTDTQLKSITMRPGIVKDTTEYMAEGGYVDCDWVRFRQGRPESIGGFISETVSQVEDATNTKFTGVARDVLAWTDLTSKKYLAVGTHKKLELMLENQIYDITPYREELTLSNAITTVNTESEVTITDANPHNLKVGDFVYVDSQATAPYNGITLSGGYEVVEIVDSTNFKIDSGTAATGSGTGGGDLDINYLLEIGYQDNGNLTGYSGGTWNTEGASGQGYNRPRAGVGGLDLRQWSLDNWGEDMVACVSGGTIYHWDATNGAATRAQELSNAPSENNFILVSQPSRHLIAFGSEVFSTGVFDPLIIRWADQETLNDWPITASNTAGEYRLPKGNRIVGAVQTRGEIVVFTESEVYSMRYIGSSTEVFRITPLGTNVGAISQHCMIDVNGVIYWLGKDNFYMYDGVIKVLNSTIDKYIFDQDGEGRINEDQKEKVYAGINRRYHEIWWFYPRFDETEIGHYVVYNYLENLYYYGEITRTVWQESGVFDRPYAIGTDGTLYIHEEGTDADGAPKRAFIRTAYFDMDEGEQLMFVDRILPDVRIPTNRNMEITFFVKRYVHPNASIQTKGPYTFNDSMNKISMRARGRQMSIQYEVNVTGASIEVGKVRIGLQPDGERS